MRVRTDDDLPGSFVPDDVLLTARDFSFTIGVGSGQDGYDVIKVRADGGCEYTFGNWERVAHPEHGAVNQKVWRRASFAVSPESVAMLRQTLVDTHYFQLKKAYYTDVCDGTQWFVKVSAGGKGKGVYCSNHFPTPVVRLREFVRQHVVESNQAAIEAAPVVELRWEEMEREFF